MGMQRGLHMYMLHVPGLRGGGHGYAEGVAHVHVPGLRAHATQPLLTCILTYVPTYERTYLLTTRSTDDLPVLRAHATRPRSL